MQKGSGRFAGGGRGSNRPLAHSAVGAPPNGHEPRLVVGFDRQRHHTKFLEAVKLDHGTNRTRRYSFGGSAIAIDIEGSSASISVKKSMTTRVRGGNPRREG